MVTLAATTSGPLESVSVPFKPLANSIVSPLSAAPVRAQRALAAVAQVLDHQRDPMRQTCLVCAINVVIGGGGGIC